MVRSRARAFIVAVILFLPFLLSVIVSYNFNEVLRLCLVHTLQNKLGGASVSLDAASLTFGCGGNANRNAGDGGGSYSCWDFELLHLRIGNAPRQNVNNGDTVTVGADEQDDWSSPFVVHLNALHLSVAGPMAFLSLLQLPLASSSIFGSPSLPRIFCNGLDFVVGFRVRSMDILEIDGLTVYIEDGEEQEQQQQQFEGEAFSEAVIKHGSLKKQKGTKHKYFDFVLEPSRLSWFEPKPKPGLHDKQGPRLGGRGRSSLRLFASSSVEVTADEHEQLQLELVSDTEFLVLHASSTDERDAWVDALRATISDLPHLHNDNGGGNAPWIEELAAEANAMKVRWRRREWRRRQEWRRRWQSKGENGRIDDESYNERVSDDGNADEGALDGGGGGNIDINGDAEDDAEDNEEDDNGSDAAAAAGEEGESGGGSGSKDFLAGFRNLHSTLKGGRSNTIHEKRFGDALEWRIGRLAIRGLALYINERHWSLDQENGWSLHGFVGSSSELRRRLRLGLGPKLLRDSGGRAIKTGISSYTGKEGYVFGDLSKSTVTKVGAGVADALHGFTGKEEYVFGDISKAAVTKVGGGVADAVQGFTGKEGYVFGDISKTAVTKVGNGVADALQGFTGKDQYEFGDVTKAVLAKLKPRRSEGGRSKLGERRRSKDVQSESGELDDKRMEEL